MKKEREYIRSRKMGRKTLIMCNCNRRHPKIDMASKETDRRILNRRVTAIQTSPPIMTKKSYVMIAKTMET